MACSMSAQEQSSLIGLSELTGRPTANDGSGRYPIDLGEARIVFDWVNLHFPLPQNLSVSSNRYHQIQQVRHDYFSTASMLMERTGASGQGVIRSFEQINRQALSGRG